MAATGRFEGEATMAAPARGEATKAAMGRWGEATMAARRFAAARERATVPGRACASPAAARIRVADRCDRFWAAKADRSVAEDHRIVKAIQRAEDCRYRYLDQVNCALSPLNAGEARAFAPPVCNRACAMAARSGHSICGAESACSNHRFVPASPDRYGLFRPGPGRHDPGRHGSVHRELEASRLSARPRVDDPGRRRQQEFCA
jgi:hypothetical protein